MSADSVLAFLGLSLEDVVITGASAAVVALMVIVAYLIGFRRTLRLDDADLANLAAAEGASVEASLIEPKGRAAVARVGGGKILVARVMGDAVGARLASPDKVAIRLRKNRLSIQIGDIGFPPLSWRLSSPAPDWLAQLAGERFQE